MIMKPKGFYMRMYTRGKSLEKISYTFPKNPKKIPKNPKKSQKSQKILKNPKKSQKSQKILTFTAR